MSTRRQDLKENIRCSLFDEQDTEDIMRQVDRCIEQEAIAFAEWIEERYVWIGNGQWLNKMDEQRTTEQLYQIYKSNQLNKEI